MHHQTPKTWSGSFHRGRRGGSALELMLLMPILLMLTLGVVDYGYYFFLKSTLQGAAQAGARAAAPASATDTSVTAVISNILTASGLSSSNYTITYSPTDITTAAVGSTVTVTITCSWANVGTHALGTSFGGISDSKQIVGVAAIRKESS
jgi:Flp pilus assembly protein TadG